MNEENINLVETSVPKSKSTNKNVKTKGLLIKKIVTNRLVILIIGIIAGLIAGHVFGWSKVTPNQGDSIAKAEQQKLVSQYVGLVGKLMILPKGEEPVIATITDSKALAKEQVFYSNAQNGDVVLVYQKAMQAIIYSPSRGVIVNVGPVYYQNDTAATSTNPVATTTPKKK